MDAVVQEQLPKLSTFKQELFDIVLGAQRNGARDMTAKEIQDAYERKKSKRVGDGNVGGRVSEMVRDGYLVRADERRVCLVTGDKSVPVFVPEGQARLFR